MALLGKRGVELAACFSKSSSSSTSTLTLTSRSLAESKRVGRRAVVGAVRGYTEDASSNSSLSNQTQKMLQLEVEMLRNELKESSERMQFQFEKLRAEIEEKIKKPPPSEEELRSEIIRGYTEDASSLSNNQLMIQKIEKLRNEKRIKESSSEELQFEIEKLRNEILRRNKESSSRSAETIYVEFAATIFALGAGMYVQWVLWKS